jgi:RNA polymerase sigma factor (sigma-70 family)
MTLHPAIHADFLRGHERDLRRRLARPGRGAAKRTKDTSDGLAELVESARSGDPQAWESLVTRLSPMLRRVAGDYRLSVADTDDVVQATWAAAFTNILQLREPEAISGWLCVTARRQALRLVRARKVEIAVEEPRRPDEADQPLFESALVQAEQLAAVHEAVDRLPARQRSVLTAQLEISGESYTHLSAKLRMPLGSIGPTRERALRRLRRDLRLASELSREPAQTRD